MCACVSGYVFASTHIMHNNVCVSVYVRRAVLISRRPMFLLLSVRDVLILLPSEAFIVAPE